MKKKHIILFILILILLISFPFIIENILVCENIFPFNHPIYFSKETWFGFIASYIGAIGTIILGIIALYQNKTYKELSDSSEEKLLVLQKEIKDLTEKSAHLIELNAKIEEAKYYPMLIDLHNFFWDTSEKNLNKNFDLINDSFQISHICDNTDSRPLSVKETFKGYHTLVYSLKNNGERTIRNFTCKSIITNNKQHEMGFWLFQSCDIEPGGTLRCVYATKQNLVKQCNDGKIESISFKYEMENVLGEHFSMTTDFYFSLEENNLPPNYAIEISPIQRL